MSALPNTSVPPTVSRPTQLNANTSDQLPTALQVLLRFQQTTTVLTLTVVGAALGFYGWTVYTPLRWNDAYQQLQVLQQQERQITVNTEAIKHQLAQEASQPNSGLVNPSPHHNIFLPEKNVEYITAQQAESASNETVVMPVSTRPMAY